MVFKMNFNDLPIKTVLWNEVLSTPNNIYIMNNSNVEHVDKIPFNTAVTLLLSYNEITKEQVECYLKLASKYNIEVCFVSYFEESSVKGLIFYNDKFDNDFSHELKFYDWDIDACHIGSLPNTNKTGLILMDMDATCVQCECIDEMAKLAGIGDKVSAVTAQAMQGHMEFQESFRRRVALFEGKPESIMDTVEENLPIMPGFAELVSKAKSFGWKLAIASGGFTRYVNKLKREFGLDYVIANNIEAIDGIFTGKVLGMIVDSKVKANTLLSLKNEYGIELSETIAVGDGANDLPMISLAGTGIAIHAKPIVREQSPIAICRMNLHCVAAILESARIINKLENNN